MQMRFDVPKAPRWITTEAGQWAWESETSWRSHATNAMYVHHRSELLSKAEQLWASLHTTTSHEQSHESFGD